jgi:hypothetical protein
MTTSHVNAREPDQHVAEPDEPEPATLHSQSQAFDFAMLRVATLDLVDPGSGSTPFILSTADLSLEARRDLLIKASSALLESGDYDGAAECLKYALGLEHCEPSDELDQVIKHGLQAIAEIGEDDQGIDDDGEEGWSTEDLVRLIEEVHQTPPIMTG